MLFSLIYLNKFLININYLFLLILFILLYNNFKLYIKTINKIMINILNLKIMEFIILVILLKLIFIYIKYLKDI
jgi:hypothetical protein